SRRRHTRCYRDWSSDVCSSDLTQVLAAITDRPQPSPQRLTRQLGVGHAFIQATHNPLGGAALGWIRELSFRDQTEKEFYGQTIQIGRASCRERGESCSGGSAAV